MATVVEALPEFIAWRDGLKASEIARVRFGVELLVAQGVNLVFPYSSEIKGSRYAIRELRIKAKGEPIRIFYAFDPERKAILLIGGNKSNDKRFYERLLAQAEALWERYLET